MNATFFLWLGETLLAIAVLLGLTEAVWRGWWWLMRGARRRVVRRILRAGIQQEQRALARRAS